MSGSGVGSPVFGSFSQSGFNINVLNATSDVFDVAGFSTITIQVALATGTFGTAVLKLQCSANGVDFFSISDKAFNAPGILGEIPIGTEHMRLKVTTAEGGTGTVDITVNAKR